MPMSSCAVAMPAMMTVVATSAQTVAFAVFIGVASLVGGGDEEEGDAGEEHGGSEEDGQLAERLELCLGAVYFCLQEVDFLVECDLLAVHFVGVDDELGDGFLVLLAGVVEDGNVCLVFLAGLLEDAHGALNFGCLAFVLDETLHDVGGVRVDVLRVLVVPEVDMVGSAAVLTDFVLQGGDAVVDAGDVVDDALVVVDNALDCGVAVVAACGAVALSLGGHCVVLSGWRLEGHELVLAVSHEVFSHAEGVCVGDVL